MCENCYCYCYCIHIRLSRFINERAFTLVSEYSIGIHFHNFGLHFVVFNIASILCVCDWICVRVCVFFLHSIFFLFVLYISRLVRRLFFLCFDVSRIRFRILFYIVAFYLTFFQCAISPSYFARAFAPSVFLCCCCRCCCCWWIVIVWPILCFILCVFFLFHFHFRCSPFTSPYCFSIHK